MLALWTGMLAGPLTALLVLQVNYTLSYVACEVRQTWFLHLTTAVGCLAVAAAGVWAWRAGYAPRELDEPLTPPVSRATSDVRARWMAVAAAALSAWFVLVIITMSIPVVVLETCQ